ncbi:MAG: hypothetical protein A2289_09280 [Deltaproteobacteria bacterium RIFOXYA12_FULL_58_15]|nr:MAG: hypothetical protein A2289_09280 [Deltaproteobacteria bacterium RIFOXYA12_FULL_58_15]
MGDLQRAIVDWLWSSWSELGIPGARHHKNVVVDPEPLIAWTPHLAAREPRLLGLAFDWCAANTDRIAKMRLPALAALMPADAVEALARFNGALRRCGADWHPSSGALDLDVGRKRMPIHSERPALIRFRIRALAGTSTRSEVLAGLLANRGHEVRASDLVAPGLNRRGVERALNELIDGAFVVARGGQRQRQFSLCSWEAFEILLGARGLRWIKWHERLQLLAMLSELDEFGELTPSMRRVEAASRWQHFVESSRRARLSEPPGPADREDIFDALLAWGKNAVVEF